MWTMQSSGGLSVCCRVSLSLPLQLPASSSPHRTQPGLQQEGRRLPQTIANPARALFSPINLLQCDGLSFLHKAWSFLRSEILSMPSVPRRTHVAGPDTVGLDRLGLVGACHGVPARPRAAQPTAGGFLLAT